MTDEQAFIYHLKKLHTEAQLMLTFWPHDDGNKLRTALDLYPFKGSDSIDDFVLRDLPKFIEAVEKDLASPETLSSIIEPAKAFDELGYGARGELTKEEVRTGRIRFETGGQQS